MTEPTESLTLAPNWGGPRDEKFWREAVKLIKHGYMHDEVPFIVDTALALYDLLKPHNLWGGGRRILDLGCGNGRLPIALLIREPDAWGGRGANTYAGIDAILESVVYASALFAEFPAFSFQWLPVMSLHYIGRIKELFGVTLSAPAQISLPFPDHYFDSILSCSLYTHLGTPEAARRYLGECYRVLAPGGRLLSTWFRNPPNTLSSQEAYTVYRESDIRAWIAAQFSIEHEWGGEKASKFDQWHIISKRID